MPRLLVPLLIVIALVGCGGTKVVHEDDDGSDDDNGSNGALTGIGAGGTPSGICGRICDCAGCSDNERDECVDELEDQLKAADDEGCRDQADAALSCYDEQLECRDAEIDLDGCDAELKSLNDCMY